MWYLRGLLIPSLLMLLLTTIQAAEISSIAGKEYQDVFSEDKTDLGPTGRNRYFFLEPPYGLFLKGNDEGVTKTLMIVVGYDTRTIDGVKTRMVKTCETRNDVWGETSTHYFAISKKTNNVYYFGEHSKEFGTRKGLTWAAGLDRTRYGMIMPGTIELGAGYYQKLAPGIAMDRGRVVGTSETLTVPAGTFNNCLKVEVTSPLHKGKTYRFYAPGVGLVRDGNLVLARYGRINVAFPEDFTIIK
jgi:hypothetical protein